MNTDIITSLTEMSGRPIRTYITEDGEIEFVAADVARVLGHRLAAHMTRVLDEDEKGIRRMPTPGGAQNLLTITESGLYHVILMRQTGRMADAETKELVRLFRRWVTHDVLPSIRKYGAYMTPATLDEVLTDRAALDQLIARLEAMPRPYYDGYPSSDGYPSRHYDGYPLSASREEHSNA